MKKFILVGVVALAFLSPVFSQIAGISTERLTRLDDFVLSEVAKGNIPGAVTLIIKDGQLVQHKALGFKDAVAKCIDAVVFSIEPVNAFVEPLKLFNEAVTLANPVFTIS